MFRCSGWGKSTRLHEFSTRVVRGVHFPKSRVLLSVKRWSVGSPPGDPVDDDEAQMQTPPLSSTVLDCGSPWSCHDDASSFW